MVYILYTYGIQERERVKEYYKKREWSVAVLSQLRAKNASRARGIPWWHAPLSLSLSRQNSTPSTRTVDRQLQVLHFPIRHTPTGGPFFRADSLVCHRSFDRRRYNSVRWMRRFSLWIITRLASNSHYMIFLCMMLMCMRNVRALLGTSYKHPLSLSLFINKLWKSVREYISIQCTCTNFGGFYV